MISVSIVAILVLGVGFGSFKYLEAKNLEAVRLEEKATMEALTQAKEQVAVEVAERDRIEEEARLKAEEEARLKAEEEARIQAEEQAAAQYQGNQQQAKNEFDSLKNITPVPIPHQQLQYNPSTGQWEWVTVK